jgi:hypothetical protein
MNVVNNSSFAAGWGFAQNKTIQGRIREKAII